MDEVKFPLCKKAGLTVHPGASITGYEVYSSKQEPYLFAKEVEALLEKAPVVNCEYIPDSQLVDEHRAGLIAHEPKVWPNRKHTHTARLVLIEPIVKKSREEFLREAMDTANFDSYFMKKAKALLEEKE